MKFSSLNEMTGTPGAPASSRRADDAGPVLPDILKTIPSGMGLILWPMRERRQKAGRKSDDRKASIRMWDNTDKDPDCRPTQQAGRAIAQDYTRMGQ
jgi:hypothetical protein